MRYQTFDLDGTTTSFTSDFTVLCGFAVKEDASIGAAASVDIRDGASTTVIPVELAANESAGMALGTTRQEGLHAANPWRVVRTAGEMSGAIWGL